MREVNYVPDSMGACPLCNRTLYGEDIRFGKFACPGCHRMLKPKRFPGYHWLRLAVCYGAGLAYAWTHGWNGSFVIFVVSFYALPALVLWAVIEVRLFPPKMFAPTSASAAVQTLDI